MQKQKIKIQGVVQRGRGRGREIGFPTANIPLHSPIESGVYKGSVTVDGHRHLAALFVGTAGEELEAHLIEYTEDLYGKKITVEVGEKIREVYDFADDEALIAQISLDVELCLQE